MTEVVGLLELLRPLLPTGFTALAVVVFLFVANRVIERWLTGSAHGRLWGQLTMLAFTLAGLLAMILSLPISDGTRGQLLSLLGIVLSAAIALSSASLIGNAMAGLMLRVTRGFRAGDFLRVGEHFGRVSERAILHVEIQTEDRDLTTLPNLFLASNPIKVVRSSGTIISAQVSLGYDVPRSDVRGCLISAATATGLADPFVQILELGDFSVIYRVGGLLTDVKRLLSTRSELREEILDQLHGAGIEIVSPNFMNTRPISEGKRFIPSAPTQPAADEPEDNLESLVFDKAEEAEKTEKVRERFQALANRLEEIEDLLKDATDDAARESLEAERDPEAERDLLSRRFGIHHLAITDALRERHPPKIEPFRDNTFIMLKGLDADSTSIEFGTIQLSIFVGERYLLTRSSGRSVSTETLLSALASGEIPPDVSRAALALRLCRTVADRFLPLLLAVEKRLDEMEAEMLSKPSDELLAELVRQKGDLKRIMRILQYHAQVFTSARSTTPAQLADHDHELTDVQEQLDRLLSLARLYYELTDDLVNGYLSLSAHRLNQIMQTLTIVTVVFVPITFMAGIYGMNFEYIPELGYRKGYFILLGAMLTVVVGILALFHHRGWLGGRGRRG